MLKKWGRRAVNVWLVFHLAVLALFPNQFSYLHQSWKSWAGAYANTFGLNTAWKFFAPDPAPAIYYEFTVTLPPQAGSNEPHRVKVMVPDEDDTFRFRQHYNRRVAIKNITVNHPEFVRTVLVPRLVCEKYPEATNVAVSRFVIRFPSLKDVQEGQHLNDTSMQRDYSFVSNEVCLSPDNAGKGRDGT